MKIPNYMNSGIMDADSSDDASVSVEKLQAQLEAAQDQLANLASDHHPLQAAELRLKIAGLLVDLQHGIEGMSEARNAFDTFIENQQWDDAVQCCEVIFHADQDNALPALGNGVWLSVTFPVDPELTVNMLSHIVEETPDDADGAAVAAATAHYVVDMRASGKTHENLSFYTNQLLGSVARRHSDVDSQEQFEYWVEKLELNDPQKFLPRLRNVVDVLVQEDWWVDRDAIWASLPDQ